MGHADDVGHVCQDADRTARTIGALGDSGGRLRAISVKFCSKVERELSAEPFDLARVRLISPARPRVDSMGWNGLRFLAADGIRVILSFP